MGPVLGSQSTPPVSRSGGRTWCTNTVLPIARRASQVFPQPEPFFLAIALLKGRVSSLPFSVVWNYRDFWTPPPHVEGPPQAPSPENTRTHTAHGVRCVSLWGVKRSLAFLLVCCCRVSMVAKASTSYHHKNTLSPSASQVTPLKPNPWLSQQLISLREAVTLG